MEKKQSKEKSGCFSNLLSQLFSLAFLAIFFIGINWVLGCSQDWWHAEDTAKLEEMKMVLKQEKAEIEGLERQLEGLIKEYDAMSESLDASEIEISRLKDEYGSTGSSLTMETHNRRVDEHNSLLARVRQTGLEYDKLAENYSAKVVGYNEKVEKANKLAEACGSRWYIVPVPGKGRSRAH